MKKAFLMRFSKIITVFVYILTFIDVWSQTETYKFRQINISDGLSNSQVRSIYVDKSGFAWFGTISGLNRYDGYSFKIFKNDPSDSLSINIGSVYRIREDYDGKLWLFGNLRDK